MLKLFGEGIFLQGHFFDAVFLNEKVAVRTEVSSRSIMFQEMENSLLLKRSGSLLGR